MLRAERYTAVGFGASNDTGLGSGLRRERSGLSVLCVGEGCGVPDVGAREWQGETAICSGDSGGPALNSSLEVTGIASRSAYQCSTPIYASLFAHAAWLRQQALRVAQARGSPAVGWAAAPQLSKGCEARILSAPAL